jgi:hypothetical protein
VCNSHSINNKGVHVSHSNRMYLLYPLVLSVLTDEMAVLA